MKPRAERPLAVDPGSLNPLPIDVVSVQSQVVYGHVGNSVAVPTLRAAGLSVVGVPTVLLSNTPHYDTLHGGVVPLDWFGGYLTDLDRRGALTHARAVLIGYLGSPDQAKVLADWLERAVAAKPELLVVLDPVMGDTDSGLYVDPGLPAVIRDRLVPLATGLTPNSYEFGQLTGADPLSAVTEAAAATGLLHGRTEWLVVTSATEGAAGADDSLNLVATRSGVEAVRWERIDTVVKGTGDMFAASLTGNLLRGLPLVAAVTAAHDVVEEILTRTMQLGANELVLH